MKKGMNFFCSVPVLVGLLAALLGGAVTAHGEIFTGPRIEATASRWTWPSRLSFVNDAMRCTFAGTNENTQLKSVDLRTSNGGFVSLIGRAAPLLERHNDAVETFTRLSDGFLMERQLPAEAFREAKGALFRTGAQLRLTGNENHFTMEEEIQILRTGATSVECFMVDVTPSQPETFFWQTSETVGTTNRVENQNLRLPAEALAICGRHGVVVLRLIVSADSDKVPAQSDVFVRNDKHGVRCSFIITENQAQAGQTILLNDLRLLPAGSTPEAIRSAIKEVRP